MAFSCFPTLRFMVWVRNRSINIRSALLRVNFGDSRRRRVTLYILICGRITLSVSNQNQENERLSLLPQLPRDEGGPVFAEPWQAQAFALAVKLSEQGYFTWKEWAAELATELKAAADRGESDDGTHYYEHWLAALERLVTIKGLTDRDALQERKEAWADAYRHTPHGKPVELRK